MKKRIITLILIAALLLGNLVSALASEYEFVIGNFGSGQVVETTYNDYEDRIFMEVGEYQIVNPLHWLDPEYLSYEVVSLTSSDPLIVTAEPYNIGSREEMGIQLHAVGATGSATVNMELRTYRTRSGLKARDERATDTQYVELKVHVWGSLSAGVSIVTSDPDFDQNCWLSSILFQTTDAYEMLPDNLRHPLLCAASDTLGAALGAGSITDPYEEEQSEEFEPQAPAAGALGVQIGGVATSYTNTTGGDQESLIKMRAYTYETGDNVKALLDIVHDGDPRYVMPTDGKEVDVEKHSSHISQAKADAKVKVGNNVYKAGRAMGMGAMIANAIKAFVAAPVEGVRRKATFVPGYEPRPLYVEISLSTFDECVTVDSITLQANEFFSFTSTAGPWGDTYTVETPIELMGDNLGGNALGAEYIKRIPIYPRAAYGNVNDDTVYAAYDGSGDSMRYAYKAAVTMDCQYRYSEFGIMGGREFKECVRGSASIDAYSKITEEDIDKYLRSMSYNMDYFRSHYGAESLAELLYVGCPVEVVVQDAEGGELAVIRTDDTDVYENEGLIAAANGDDKILAIDPAATDLYRIYVRALEDGNMDVLSSGADAAGDLDANVYEQTPISAGDVFEIQLSGKGAGKLYALKDDGSGTEVEPTMTFNRESVMKDLQESDISAWALEPVTEAVLSGLVSEIACESFQDAISAEEFCGMLLSLYETYYDLVPGETVSNYGEANPDAEEFTAVDVAASVGLVPQTFQKQERQFGGGIDRETAAEWIQQLVRQTLVDLDIADVLTYYDEYLYFQNGEYLSDIEYLKMFEGTEGEIEQLLNQKAERTPPALEDLAGRGIMARDMSGEEALSYEEAMAVIGETWEYLNSCFRRNDLVLSAIEAATESFESINLTIYAVPEEQGGDKALDSFMLHFPAFPAKYLNVDRVNGYIEVLEGLDVGGVNPVNDSKTDGSKLMMFECALGMLTTDPGKCTLEFAPVYYPDGAGGIYEDAVYLMASRNTYGKDEMTLMLAGQQDQGDYQVDTILIADQDVVARYVELMRPNIERYVEPEDETVYPELSKGSRGDEAKALQKALIQKGFLTGTADGIYGNMTAEAVSAFQTSVGMEATGIADHETQKLLFAVPDQKQLLLDWLDRQS